MINIPQNKLKQLYELNDYLWLEETIILFKNKRPGKFRLR